jgi:hypothetical protein
MVIAAGVILTSAILISQRQQDNARLLCQGYLKAIYDTMLLYINEHDGRFPKDFDDLDVASDGGILSIATCPGVHPGKPNWNTKQHIVDYIYLSWGFDKQPKSREEYKEYANYPVLYERRLNHHGSPGMNVITLDRKVFWDPDGKWLKGFAATHPDIKIPMPY